MIHAQEWCCIRWMTSRHGFSLPQRCLNSAGRLHRASCQRVYGVPAKGINGIISNVNVATGSASCLPGSLNEDGVYDPEHHQASELRRMTLL